MLIRQGYEEVVRLTIFSCLLYEGVNAAFPVAALRGHGGDVVPAHEPDDVHHGLRLIGVWGHHAREEVVASVVTQLGSRGGVAHLGDLWRTKTLSSAQTKSHGVDSEGLVIRFQEDGGT